MSYRLFSIANPFKVAIAATTCLVAFGTTAMAGEFSGSVGLTSNYVFRGVTQTDDAPALSASFDYSSESGFYAGVWGSNVDFDDEADIELNLYAGYGFSAGGWDFDLGAIYYFYPGADYPELPGEPEFLEFYGGASKTFDALTWDVKLSYGPELYFDTDAATYMETGLAYAISESVSVDARIGYSDFDNDSISGYTDYQIGISGPITENIGWDIRAFSATGGRDDAFAVSLSADF